MQAKKSSSEEEDYLRKFNDRQLETCLNAREECAKLGSKNPGDFHILKNPVFR
jgi:hypothetical protein